jgi:hypothetical protein
MDLPALTESSPVPKKLHAPPSDFFDAATPRVAAAPDFPDLTTADRRPPTANRRPPTADRRPPTADRRPPTADRQPPTDDRQPTKSPPSTGQRHLPGMPVGPDSIRGRGSGRASQLWS